MKKIFLLLLSGLLFTGCTATKINYVLPPAPVGSFPVTDELQLPPKPLAAITTGSPRVRISWCRSIKDAPTRALVYEVWSCTSLALQNWQLVSVTPDLFYEASAGKAMEFFRVRSKDVLDGMVGEWATNEPCGTF